jgi:hypothetical protein
VEEYKLWVAKIMKRTPPVKATVRWEILVAINRPPMTARPVHHIIPPSKDISQHLWGLDP